MLIEKFGMEFGKKLGVKLVKILIRFLTRKNSITFKNIFERILK